MVSNEHISKEIEEGVKRAFENLDITTEVENCVKNSIQLAIKHSYEWNKISEQIRTKIDEVIDSYIEKSISEVTKNFIKRSVKPTGL